MWWGAGEVVQCPEMRFILIKVSKPKLLQCPAAAQRLPVWKHERRARTASENRESDRIGITTIQVVIE